MPSSMIHLWTARLTEPDAGALFLIGNIAPDGVSERAAKDRIHLRGAPERKAALRSLAASLDTAHPFRRGALLHLYADLLWDETLQAEYAARHGADWFLPYRNEIGLAGAHIYHTQPWGEACWRAMEGTDPSEYAVMDDLPPEGIRDFITRNAKWHRENRLPASEAFPPEVVEHFVQEAAKGFAGFMKAASFA